VKNALQEKAYALHVANNNLLNINKLELNISTQLLCVREAVIHNV